MPRPCAAMFDNLRPVRSSLLTERITTLSPARMAQACAAPRLAVDC